MFTIPGYGFTQEAKVFKKTNKQAECYCILNNSQQFVYQYIQLVIYISKDIQLKWCPLFGHVWDKVIYIIKLTSLK